MIYFIAVITAIIFFMPSAAHAGYLDPGSGSTLAQAIAAFVARISRFFSKLFGKGE